MRTDVVLLPGLHGSIALFDTFIALAPPWANCLPIPLPTEGDQSFGALADQIEGKLRGLEGFVLFGESFAGPIAARLAKRLGSKISLLVLCNPLVEPPLRFAPPFAATLLRSALVPAWVVAFALAGGNRSLAAAVQREILALPKDVLGQRLRIACAARREDVANRLKAPVLAIVGSGDRLVSPKVIKRIIRTVPFAAEAMVLAPHLAAQVAPVAVWSAITEQFQRAA